jgi:peptidoglycan/LPS O-acetylase OafA/YrhL
MPPVGQDEAGKLAWLDALRGWAILLVLLTHAGQGEFALRALDSFAPHAPRLVLPTWLANIAGNAGFGVQLFFVVSAFSLTRSTLARAVRGESVGASFLVRRVARVGPAFWLAAIGYTAFFGDGPRLMASHGIDGVDFGLTIALLHVWRPEALNSVVPGGWSVGCEMMFCCCRCCWGWRTGPADGWRCCRRRCCWRNWAGWPLMAGRPISGRCSICCCRWFWALRPEPAGW